MHHASIDRYAGGDSPVHRLDARVKLLAALVFTGAAVSEPRTELQGLFPYLVPPLVAVLVSGVPLGFVARRVLLFSPFALLMGGANALFETAPVTVTLGPLSATMRAGFVTGAAIVLKYLISMLALLPLVTTTRVGRLAGAMSSLGVPRLLAMQVVFTYRYLFLVVDEYERRSRAAAARRVGPVSVSHGVVALSSSLATLFLRSLDRSERVSQAMSARGFDGTFVPTPSGRLRPTDLLFLALTVFLALGLRLRGVWLAP